MCRYSIGEVAEIIGVPTSTLRYYDKEGILPFVKRTEGNVRSFAEEDLEWLRVIECLKKTKMSIKEIKQFIDWCIEGDSTIDKRLDLINRRRDLVLKEIESLQETLKTLDYKKWYYETAKAAGTTAIHTKN